MNKPVILVTGKNGQLGYELSRLAVSFPGYDFIFTDRSTLDIGDGEAVANFFENKKIDFCINAAAYTAVDRSETEKDLTMLINGTAVGNLADACQKQNCRLIHISTDYVFDGNAQTPYLPEHPVNPVNYYGQTKLMGEKLARQNNPGSVIIRTSWVYSSHGNNFVKTMLRLMSDRDNLNVVSDQVGSPTYAADLAEAIMQVIGHLIISPQSEGGIFHFSNEGIISWYDFALAIKRFEGKECAVNPIPTADFPTPAKRPAYSVLDKTSFVQTFGISLKNWEESLRNCIDLL